MITKTLYRYHKGEAVIDSLVLPEGQIDYIERYRLVADKGKVLTKDHENFYTVIDIDKADNLQWYEINKPETLDLW